MNHTKKGLKLAKSYLNLANTGNVTSQKNLKIKKNERKKTRKVDYIVNIY